MVMFAKLPPIVDCILARMIFRSAAPLGIHSPARIAGRFWFLTAAFSPGTSGTKDRDSGIPFSIKPVVPHPCRSVFVLERQGGNNHEPLALAELEAGACRLLS